MNPDYDDVDPDFVEEYEAINNGLRYHGAYLEDLDQGANGMAEEDYS